MKEEIFYNKKEDCIMKLINKGNFIYYNELSNKYINNKDLLTIEECYKILSNKLLKNLIKI
jgi:hypothetical protein